MEIKPEKSPNLKNGGRGESKGRVAAAQRGRVQRDGEGWVGTTVGHTTPLSLKLEIQIWKDSSVRRTQMRTCRFSPVLQMCASELDRNLPNRTWFPRPHVVLAPSVQRSTASSSTTWRFWFLGSSVLGTSTWRRSTAAGSPAEACWSTSRSERRGGDGEFGPDEFSLLCVSGLHQDLPGRGAAPPQVHAAGTELLTEKLRGTRILGSLTIRK